MGVDHLDFTFCLEKSFGIKLGNTWLLEAAEPVEQTTLNYESRPRTDIRAGEIHEFICRELTKTGRPIPPSSWHRVTLCAARVAGKSPWVVKPESWLREDLGFE
jgi:hypothetical protein